MRHENEHAANDDGVHYEDSEVVYDGDHTDNLVRDYIFDASDPTYPLSVSEYKRLNRRRDLAKRSIQTVIVPALCDVDEVQQATHNLTTIPLKDGISSDPEARDMLDRGRVFDPRPDDTI